MRKHVSALFPLRNASKNSFEVLRLGSGERRETDPRTSNRAYATELHQTMHWSTPSRMPQRAPRQV